MKRRKNLERAIVLGLLLSTSVYGSAWAESLDDFKNNAVDGKITVTEDTFVDGTGGSLIYGDTANSIYDVTIEVSDNSTLTLKNVNATKPNIIGNGNIAIETAGTGPVVTGAGDGYIHANNMTIQSNGVGISSYGGRLDIDLNGTLNITSDNIGIHAQMNGEHPEKASIIEIDADKLIVNAADRGIYLTNAEVKQDIKITLKNGAVINSTGAFAGIQNSNQLGGELSISSEKDAISITGGTQGAWVTYGSITNLEAENIYLNAKSNAILNNNNSEDTGYAQITVKATNGNNTLTGNYGINSNDGTVILNAVKGSNIINADNVGVYASGENSTVTMTGKDNIITVNDSGIDKPFNTSGIHVTDGGDYIIEKNDGNDTTIDVTGHAKENYGVFAEKQGFVDVDTNNLTVKAKFDSLFDGGNSVRGIYSEQSKVDIDADGLVNINVTNINKGESTNADGIYAEAKDPDNNSYDNSEVYIDAKEIVISVNAEGNTTQGAAFGVQAKTVPDDGAKAAVNLTATGENGILITSQSTSTAYGLSVADNAEINVEAVNGDIRISANGGSGTVSEGIQVGSIDIASSQNEVIGKVSVSGLNTTISGSYSGIHANYGKSFVDINATNGSNDIFGGSIGVRSENGADVKVTANSGNNIVSTDNGSYGIYLTNTTLGNITSESFTGGKNAKVTLEANNNIINNSSYGIYEYAYSDAILKAEQDNNINAKNYGIYTSFESNAELTAENNNYIAAGNTDNGYGSRYAVYAFDDGISFKGSTVNILAKGQNALLGAVYTKGSGVDSENNVVATNITLEADTNIVKSATSIANAGGLKDTTVISALYAEAGAQINVSGENNTILSYADYDKPEILERAVWAYDRADITIDGATTISTDSYEKSSNSNDIAIAAGTGTGLTEEIVSAPVADRSTVTLTYNNYTNGAKSNITGNILSAYTGTVDIKGVNDSAGIDVTGDLLAGNNGELNLNLGNGGILKGRADDYGDAGVVNNGHANTFKDPAFSSEIHKGGVVNLTMGDNSRWNVTGQSWITSITTDHEEENAEHNHIIDLISDNTDRNEAAHALTVYNFDGNATFNMSLDADRSISDMLYIKNADGNYIINVVDAVTEDDIYAVKSDGGTFDGLRFATVGKGSTASFKAITYDQGFNNIEYMIGTDSYNESDENHHYNGESLDAEKPGDETVDEFFKNEGTPGSTTESTNGIATASLMLAAANEAGNAAAGTTAEADDLTDVEVNTDETTNFKLIGVKNTDLSDGGETILNMSRANYSNAIYMDRLNKRLGEARYINDDPEEDEGMWVRIRHDRIGKEDAFRSQNTMYQLGYDKRQECDNGERRVGFAVDYMHGDTGYTDIAGKGEIDRYGLWLYDTWMGDKGHYADYIAKWGHLDNDFEIYAPTTGQRIDGDYSNNVFSVSAEYGRKKDIGNDWYFEPQAQLQLARVTGADYTTSQGTKVSVDGINSLIGRAGFRIGKDFGEEKQSTLYFKADVLHEFLGDQDISAMDKTTNGNWSTISYENEGTWYDIGIGYAAMMSKSSYAFIDLEQSFGNDNDDTYQINAGVRWTF